MVLVIFHIILSDSVHPSLFPLTDTISARPVLSSPPSSDSDFTAGCTPELMLLIEVSSSALFSVSLYLLLLPAYTAPNVTYSVLSHVTLQPPSPRPFWMLVLLLQLHFTS